MVLSIKRPRTPAPTSSGSSSASKLVASSVSAIISYGVFLMVEVAYRVARAPLLRGVLRYATDSARSRCYAVLQNATRYGSRSHDDGWVKISRGTDAVESPAWLVTVYRRHNKPTLGTLGDSLDDFR